MKKEYKKDHKKSTDIPSRERNITYYPTGVIVNSGVKPMKNTGKKIGGTRGNITSFSYQSRQRMRMFMLTHSVDPDLLECAVTLTIPGDILTADEKNSLWNYWTQELKKRQWACLWRLEVQTRGQYHWHCIMGVRFNYGDYDERYEDIKNQAENNYECNPDKYAYVMRRDVKSGLSYKKYYTWQEWITKEMITALWQKVLPGKRPYKVNEYTVDVEIDKTGSSWRRYMQDHASKSKNEQIADIGKHWGVINRKLFNELIPDLQQDFVNESHFYKFRRVYNRLINGRKNKKRRLNRMRQGKAVYFSRPETVDIIYTWAWNEVFSQEIVDSEPPF